MSFGRMASLVIAIVAILAVFVEIPACLGGCSHPEYQDPFQGVDDANHRAASCCDRGGLRRNPNNNRLRLLDFGSRLSRLSWQFRLFFEMKVDLWFAYLALRLQPQLYKAADGFGAAGQTPPVCRVCAGGF